VAVDRIRRALNAVRDAQEMLERIVRKGPVALRRTLPASIEDLEWTADALSTALLALQETGNAPAASPVAGPELTATRPS
jgi:prophage DNA circulation protein